QSLRNAHATLHSCSIGPYARATLNLRKGLNQADRIQTLFSPQEDTESVEKQTHAQFWGAHAAGVHRSGRWPNGWRSPVNSLLVISTCRSATWNVFGRPPKTAREPRALPNHNPRTSKRKRREDFHLLGANSFT